MCGPKFRSMKITQDARNYAGTLNDKEQGLSAEALANAGMADMSRKFIDVGAAGLLEQAEKVKESNKALFGALALGTGRPRPRPSRSHAGARPADCYSGASDRGSS